MLVTHSQNCDHKLALSRCCKVVVIFLRFRES
jgi:hypothetical protein